MKAIKITTDNVISIIDKDLNDFRVLQKEVDGLIEIVRTKLMRELLGKDDAIFVCDEEGLLKEKNMNLMASYMYGTFEHGQPIVGDIVLAREDGEFLTGLSDAENLVEWLVDRFDFLHKEESKHE